jgi:Putative Actinobacterial Holin-X, holin superfamily III
MTETYPQRSAAPAHLAGPGANEPPLKDVLVELWHNLEKLVRQEIALASAELDVKAQKLKADAAQAAIGAGLLLAGALALVAAVILLLDLVMAAWLAALITGGVAAGVGFGLVKANKPSPADVVPERSLQNIQKDLQTFRESTK